MKTWHSWFFSIASVSLIARHKVSLVPSACRCYGNKEDVSGVCGRMPGPKQIHHECFLACTEVGGGTHEP